MSSRPRPDKYGLGGHLRNRRLTLVSQRSDAVRSALRPLTQSLPDILLALRSVGLQIGLSNVSKEGRLERVSIGDPYIYVAVHAFQLF